MSSVIKVAQEDSKPIDRPEFRAAGRDGRIRGLGDRPRSHQTRSFAATGKRLRKLPIDTTALKQAGLNGTLNRTVIETPD